MKKIAFNLLLLLTFGGALSSCKDQDKLPAPEVEELPIIFPQVTPGKDFFEIGPAQAAESTNPTRPVFEFTIDPGNQRDVKLATIEVYRSYRRGALLGPRLKVGDYSSFPATISINSKEAIKDLQRLSAPATGNILSPTEPPTNPSGFNNFIVPNDAIVFTFEYVLQDGRRIVLTPLNKVKLAPGSIPESVDVPSGTLATTAAGSTYPYAAVAVFRPR
jgi:hypothetical protein